MSLDPDIYFEIAFPRPDGSIQRRSFTDPVDILITRSLSEVAEVINRLERAVAAGLTAVGFVSYEAAAAFDTKLTTFPASEFPLALFALFPEGADLTENESRAIHQELPWNLDTPLEEYEQKLAAIREAIRRGDTYQVNFTLRSTSPAPGDGLALYRQFTKAQNANYSAYLRFEHWQILSVSPELFFDWDGSRIVTRPIKGTAARNGETTEAEAAAAQRLLVSTKDRAENVMIVDLLRNDLGRISEYGTVSVDELFSLETYPTFFQLASQISAKTRSGTSLLDLFRALFPCGSVTGAPKRSTMAQIAALETSPRGVYCGAIGIVEPGRAVFSVPIRTTVIDANTKQAVTGLGSGVTWDSNAQDEYAEIAVKARYLNAATDDWSLLETLRLEDGEYWLLEEHVDRLRSSAKLFRIEWSEPALREALCLLAYDHPESRWRVRLLLNQRGHIQTEIYELNDLPESLTVALSTKPISSADIWLQNKTTRRFVYEDRLKEFEKTRARVFDVLLINERGELTEFTRGNLVLRQGHQFVTPPLSSGLLNGTLRRDLIKSGSIIEQTLFAEDLHKAQEIWFINSVRGWVPVSLAK